MSVLNQQRPLESVAKRQPLANHSGLEQVSQHFSMVEAAMEPIPGVCGLMSLSCKAGPHVSDAAATASSATKV